MLMWNDQDSLLPIKTFLKFIFCFPRWSVFLPLLSPITLASWCGYLVTLFCSETMPKLF